jgi:hypothetical protein
MIIKLDGKELQVSDAVKYTLIEQLFGEGLKIFDKLGMAHQILAEQVTRGVLYSMEKKMLNAGMSKEAALLLRPDKKQSPTIKLLDVMRKLALDHDLPFVVSLKTDEDNTIYHVELETPS